MDIEMSGNRIDKESPNIESLPKWARERIVLLEMRLREANTKLDALFPDAKTDTYWDESYKQKRSLPPGARIRFFVGAGEFEFIGVRLAKGELEIQGTDSIYVMPGGENSIKVRLMRTN